MNTKGEGKHMHFFRNEMTGAEILGTCKWMVTVGTIKNYFLPSMLGPIFSHQKIYLPFAGKHLDSWCFLRPGIPKRRLMVQWSAVWSIFLNAEGLFCLNPQKWPDRFIFIFFRLFFRVDSFLGKLPHWHLKSSFVCEAFFCTFYLLLIRNRWLSPLGRKYFLHNTSLNLSVKLLKQRPIQRLIIAVGFIMWISVH